MQNLFRTKPERLAVVIVAISVLGIALVWLSSGDDPSPWAEATTPATLMCESTDCIRLPPIDAGHGGEGGLNIAYDPGIDDAVSQWGDCLSSVLSCRGETGDTHACVQGSVCPETCREGFAVAASGQTDEAALGQLFLTYFVEDGGACVPPSEDAQ